MTKNLSWNLRGLPSSGVKGPPQDRQMKFVSCFDTKFDVHRGRDFSTIWVLNNFRFTYHPSLLITGKFVVEIDYKIDNFILLLLYNS